MTADVSNVSIDTPWIDYASSRMPDDYVQVLRWAQYLWMVDGNYRSAMERVARHFITTLDFPDVEAEEETEYKEFFENQQRYDVMCESAANELLAYGIVVAGIYLPFKRYLRCTSCGHSRTIENTQYSIQMSGSVVFRRKGPCPICGDTHPFEVDDRKDPDMSRVKINFYSPFELDIAYNRHSQRREVYWRIPSKDRSDYLSGSRIFIDDTPLEFLQAAAANRLVRLEPDYLFVEARDGLSGFRTNGRGMPEAIKVFRAAWLSQQTNRADQAVALDFTMGKRVISPAVSPQAADPLITDMAEFSANVTRILDEQRANPTRVHTVPYPLNYQFMGGEGGALIPPDKLKFRHQEFLSQLNVPLEYHQMNFSTQAAPMALRLFETCWRHVPNMYNRLLAWVVDVTAKHFDLVAQRVKMRRSTIADDEVRKQLLTQLMAGNQISPQTALEPYDIDAADEVRKVYKHRDLVARVEAEHAEDAMKTQEMGAMQMLTAAPTAGAMAAQMQAPAGPGATMGGSPAGGLPGGAGGGQQNPTLGGMSEQAGAIAQQLVVMPEYDRKQQLRGLRESNKDLHALVMAEMDRIRSGARSQGQQMILAQPPAGG